jgi:hypothetical protein
VDETYTEITGAGYTGRQPPYDASWGAQYAIVEDPDGNPVGLMSLIDATRKSWPPGAAAKPVVIWLGGRGHRPRAARDVP